MTTFGDEISSGTIGLTSAQSTRGGVLLTRQRLFNGQTGNQTWTGFFPYDAVGINANLYIMGQGSAAQSDTMTISTSAGQTTLMTFSSFGSAQGILGATTVGLGTRTVVASACFRPASVTNPEGSDIPFRVVLSASLDSPEYGLSMTYRRRFKPGT